MGWAARIASHIDSTNTNSFLIQQVTLSAFFADAPTRVLTHCAVLGPAFFSAALYGLLGAIMLYVSPSRAVLRPKFLAPLFITCDVISLAVQGAGGALGSGSSL
jgi:hypothetical protein